MSKPFILGLTGSIGMGKSTVATMFREGGVPVFDADATVRALQGPDGALLAAIEAQFPHTTGPQGVDRGKLGAAVFGNPPAMARLEAIVHPAVAQAREAFLSDHANEALVAFDIPLLFERTGRETVDAVAVVSAPPEAQRARVLAREGMSEAKFAAILAQQMPDAQKRALADYVIDTGTTPEATAEAVGELIAKLRQSRAN